MMETEKFFGFYWM